MIKVMIADDNINLVSSYSKFLTKDKNISLCSIANDGQEALDSYLHCRPDVLLLDLDMPILNGAEIINCLSNIEEERKKRNIIVITGHSEVQSKFLKLTKVYDVIHKPVNFDVLLNCIYETAKTIEKKELDINKVKEIFVKLNLNPFSKGANYLLLAIELCYEDEKLIDNMKYLYGKIAFRKNISEKKVQWRIENSLKSMCKYVDVNILNSIFLYNDLRPRISPKYFIELMLEYINRKM